MVYSKKVIQHFKHPHNQGMMKNADAVGRAGNPVCGDVMKIYLKIRKPSFIKTSKSKRGMVIADIKFETLGCAAAIAVSSALTDHIKGMALDEALKVKKGDIVKDLGGLPPAKIHCSMLGLEALRKAIKNYELRIKNN